MSSYTICPKLVEYCGDEPEYLFNILYVFYQRNPYKICIDKDGKLLEEYSEIAKKNHLLSAWISAMANNTQYIESIDIKNPCLDNETALSICTNTFEKNLAIKSTHDYINFKEVIKEHQIKLLDKDSLYEKFTQERNTTIINQNGDYSQASTGNNSPNTNKLEEQ